MRARTWVLLLWSCFILRATFYACAIPLWEGFDEYSHYARIEYLATHAFEPSRDTPVPEDVARTLGELPTRNGGKSFDEYWKLTPAQRRASFSVPQAFIYEKQQPPLFYWVLAALYRVLGNASLVSRVISMRIFCVLLASVCVPIGFLIARQVFGKLSVALAATTLIAAMPLLTFTATHIANDALAIGLGALVILLALRRQGLALGLALGAALLTKATFLAFLPPILLLLFFRTTRKAAAMALCGAVAIAAWWYSNTWITTGSLTGNFLLMQPSLAQMLWNIPRLDWLKAADFGWMTFVWTGNWSFLVVRSWMYRLMAVLVILAMAGIVQLLRKRNREIALLSAFLGSFALSIGYFALGTFTATGHPGAFGWYACSLAGPFAVAMIAGLRSIAPSRVKPAAGPILVISFAALELFGAHFYLLPYYTGFISHLPNGGLPAFQIAQLEGGGFRQLFERLTLLMPGGLTPPVLMTLWVLFLLATIALMTASIRLARMESSASL